MIAELEKNLADDPEFAFCRCERLLQTKNVTAFDFSESKKITSNMWQVLKAYMNMSDPEATNKTLCVSVLPAHSEPGQAAIRVCSELAGS